MKLISTSLVLCTVLWTGTALASWTPLGYSIELFNAVETELGARNDLSFHSISSFQQNGSNVTVTLLNSETNRVKVLSYKVEEEPCGWSVCPLKAKLLK